jgi:hypothetical protein
VNWLLSNRHLVTALSVKSRSVVHSGHTFFHLVNSYTRLAPMPSGNRFVKFVMRAIVGLRCMHVFRFFSNFISRSCKMGEYLKQCGHIYGPVWDLKLFWFFLGKLWVPVENSKIICNLHFGLLGCLFPGESSTQTLFKEWWIPLIDWLIDPHQKSHNNKTPIGNRSHTKNNQQIIREINHVGYTYTTK